MTEGLRIDRARHEVERLPLTPGDPDAFYDALLAILAHHGLRYVGACWHLTDPQSGVFTWTGYTGELPGEFVSALANEFFEEDVAKYMDLARRRVPVAGLVTETAGHPERSARFRHQMAPDGFADELRIAFVDGYGRWGSMGLFSDAPYTEEDQAAAAELVPLVARALRTGMALAEPLADAGPPGVLVLDADDRVRTRDARADALLAGCATTHELPGAVHVLAARARLAGGPAQGRTLTSDGAWLAIDASPLVDEPGAVAVVLRPASPPSVLDVRLRAAGLTDREREIAMALMRGEDTGTIAATLHLSPWTVQDHLKAIFDKTGVRSRRAFVAKWALQAAGVEP
jgi:DNA-binding CsgD family transcriptional regulator